MRAGRAGAGGAGARCCDAGVEALSCDWSSAVSLRRFREALLLALVRAHGTPRASPCQCGPAAMHLCARGAMASGIRGRPSRARARGRRSAGRRIQLRAHEARRALWTGAHASRRSTAAFAPVSRETVTGLGPRFAGGIGASLSASSSRPARSGQAGGAPRPPECPVTNRTRRRRIPLHRPNVTGRRPPASRIRNLYSRN